MLMTRVLAFAAVAAAVFAEPSGFHLRHGDTVVFYGDSITDQRLYTTFVETFAVTRYPHLNVKFVHSGWGGDRVSGGGGGSIDVRLARDVFPYKPTVITVMLGMNDGRYTPFEQPVFDEYAAGYEKIVRELKRGAPDARITLIQPSPFDDATRPPTMRGGYNTVLLRFSDFVKQLAAKHGLMVADLNTNVVRALEKAKATDPEGAKQIIPDRVHPEAGGHLLMAAELLRAWKAPEVVSAVEIDAAAGKVTNAVNTRVAELSASSGLRWTQLDRALPMPIEMKDPATALAVRSSDFVASFNMQLLRVMGLAPGRYALSVDGEPVGSFSAAELANSINLAMLPTPMAKQAAAVHDLTLKHNDVHFARWRTVEVPLAGLATEKTRAAIDALDALEADLVAAQRRTVQPKSRNYVLMRE
jgi:lysophospholipase L1-like esterase